MMRQINTYIWKAWPLSIVTSWYITLYVTIFEVDKRGMTAAFEVGVKKR